MSVYISGVEMPTKENETIIRIQPDGTVLDQYGHYLAITAIPVPEHGDLIDLNAPVEAQYYDEMTEEWSEITVTVEDVLYGCVVSEMPPVIIPADQAEEEVAT